MEDNRFQNIIKIWGKFKDLKRSGWLMYKVQQPESDADHSFGLALLVMMLAPQNLDKLKCIKLALIHDLPEVYVGDFTPFDNISKDEKHKMEIDAAKRLAKELEWAELEELVKEYNEQRTSEARFVWAADKMETAMTACYYDYNERTLRKLKEKFTSYAQTNINRAEFPEIGVLKEMINLLRG